MATISDKPARGRGAVSGAGILFTTAMLLVLGVFDAIQGLVALFKDDVFVIGASGLVLTTDFTTWGWALLVWGAVLILAALSLYGDGTFGRTVGIVVVTINMIAQFAFFPAYPLWSLLVIGASVVVLWALTLGWSEAPRAERR